MVAAAAPVSGGVPAATMSPLLTSAAIFGAANTLGFGISVTTGSHYHLDLIGTGVFAFAAAATAGIEARQRLSAGVVALWATKLAGFLTYRVTHTQHDARLDDQLATTKGARNFWLVSFVWGFVVSLPHVIAAGVTPRSARPRLGLPSDWVGVGILALGLLVETAADYQKWTFKSDAANKGKFCDAGVWQISQHPNWLGNLLLWTGLTALNAPTLLADAPKGVHWAWRGGRLLGAALSPAFLAALFYAQATDTIAHTVALADARYGADPRYREYVATTPLVLPTPSSVARLFSST